MRHNKWVLLLPYFLLIVWSSTITFIAFNNIDHIRENTYHMDHSTAIRDSLICEEDNKTRFLSSQIIQAGINGHSISSPQWLKLQKQLATDLMPINCNKITSSQLASNSK